jgi:hypothetical protein
MNFLSFQLFLEFSIQQANRFVPRLVLAAVTDWWGQGRVSTLICLKRIYNF